MNSADKAKILCSSGFQGGRIDVVPSLWPRGTAATILHTAQDVLICLAVTFPPAAGQRFMHSKQIRSKHTLHVRKLQPMTGAELLASLDRLTVLENTTR